MTDVEKLRLFVNSEEIDYSELSIETSNDLVVDKAKIKVAPAIAGVVTGAKLDVTKNDGVTNVARLEIQEIKEESMWELDCLGNGFELSNIKIEKVYPSGTTPEEIVEDIIDNFTANLSYESDWVSGFVFTKRYIADGYAIDILEDMINLLDAQIRIKPNDTVYFERKGVIDNGAVLENGNMFNIDDFTEEKESLFNEVKIKGGFENHNTEETKTGDGSTVEFTLNSEPQGSVRVLINSTEINPNEYEVVRKEKKIIFDTAPSNGASITIRYDFNKPVVVIVDDEDSKAEAWGTVRVDLEAEWLESFQEARQYGRSLLKIYAYPLVQCKGLIPFLNFDLSVGEIVRVIDSFRGKNIRLVINKITYRNGETDIDLGTREEVYHDWQRKVQERIKTLEKRAETAETITFAKLLRHKAKLKLTFELTAEYNSPVDSFILGHQTLGRMRAGFDNEPDCSDNDNDGVWYGTGVTEGDQFVTSGYRLSGGSFNGSDRYVNVGGISGLKSILFALDNTSTDSGLINLNNSPEINIYLENDEIKTTGLGNVDIQEEVINGYRVVYVGFAEITANDIDIGKVGSSYLNGVIDEVKLYTEHLTTEKIIKFKNKEQYMTDCVCYLSFDNPKLGDRSTARQSL